MIGDFFLGSVDIFDRFECDIALFDLARVYLLDDGHLTAGHRSFIHLYLDHVPLSRLLGLLTFDRFFLNTHRIHIPLSSFLGAFLFLECFALVFRGLG